MSDGKPLDYAHLLAHAQARFTGAKIVVIHAPDERIHIEVNGHRFTFEISSDDDEYVFTDGKSAFTVPLMEPGEDSWDLP